MKKLLIIVAMVVLVSSLIVGGCAKPPQEAKVLKVGVIYGLTGPGSQSSLSYRDAVLLCKDWINSKGGITVNGEKYLIECFVEDDTMSPPGGITAATKLVHQEKVQFIVGGVIPVINQAVASVTDPNKVLFIAAWNDIVYPDKPYFFVGNHSFAAPLPGLYEVLLEEYPNVKTMGYIMEDEPGARMMTELSQNIARARGLNVLEEELHPWESTEYFPTWTKIMTQKSDAIDQGLKMPQNVANCVKQGRELGFTGPIFGAIGGGAYLTLNMIGKEYANDFFWPAFDPYGTEAPPMVKEINKLWEKAYDYPLDNDVVHHFGLLWSLAQAMEKAQSLDTTDVKNTLEKMDTIETPVGTARIGGAQTFGINNMIFQPCGITRLKNGELDFIKWVDPWMP